MKARQTRFRRPIQPPVKANTAAAKRESRIAWLSGSVHPPRVCVQSSAVAAILKNQPLIGMVITQFFGMMGCRDVAAGCAHFEW